MADDAIYFDLKEYNDFIDTLRNFDDKQTRKDLLKVMRKNAKLAMEYAKNEVPVSERNHRFRGEEIERGNLKRSLKIFTGRSKEYPNVQVGHSTGRKAKNDGFYGFFVHEGHASNNKYEGDDYMDRTNKKFQQPVAREIQDKFIKQVDKLIQKRK